MTTASDARNPKQCGGAVGYCLIKDDSGVNDDVEADNVAEDEVEEDDVAEDEVEGDDVEDDDVKGEEDDYVEDDEV